MSTKRTNSTTKRANRPKRAKLGVAAEVAFGETMANSVEKGEAELELEEAVFGTSRGGKTSVWDHELAAGVDYDQGDEFVETGLERLEDDNVSLVVCVLIGSVISDPSWLEPSGLADPMIVVESDLAVLCGCAGSVDFCVPAFRL